ncbi:MAG: UDP-3-O-(3-hydroxymyristoyl)glucosamine N-acyltransferase [bacterium]
MTLIELAEELNGVVDGGDDKEILGIAPLESASSNDVSFLSNSKYIPWLKKTNAGAVIVNRQEKLQSPCALIRVENAYMALAKAQEIFSKHSRPAPGYHASAIIDDSALIEDGVYIGASAVIDAETIIGEGCIIENGCIINKGCRLGKDCHLHSNVILEKDTLLGERVIIQAGAVIGSDGFGFAKDDDGRYRKILQTGRVVIEDDVEIGANTTVDRATMGTTTIHRGTKIDNLVQVAHNVEIGEHTVIAGQAGISGSTKIGKNVMIGGQAGFIGHIQVGDKAIINAQSGVTQNIPTGEMWSDTPARPFRLMRRIQAAMFHLPELIKRVKKIEEKN